MFNQPKRRKRVTTPKKTVERPEVEAAPEVESAPEVEAAPEVEPAPEAEAKPKSKKPTFASQCRRKADLIAEVKAERVDPNRKAELHAIIDGELADIPNLSHAELQRLGA